MQFIDLKRQQQHIRESLDRRIAAVLEHGNYIMGPEIAELERALANYAGVKHCLTCASGTDALLMALMAYGVGPGDAIFTTPFTFIATAEVIALLGATPVFVDIDTKTFNIDPAQLKTAIDFVAQGRRPSPGSPPTLRVRGIIPVDLFGLPADYEAINAIARDRGLFVLEDACQSFGALYHGKKACSLADIAATSFFPAKPLGCYGDGGAVFTDDDRPAAIMRSIRIHGQGSDKYNNARIGINGRCDTMQAAVLLAKMEIFEREMELRQIVAARYSTALAGVVTPPSVPAACRSAWAQYSVLSDHRDALMAKLKDAGIPTAIYYPKPLHLQEAFAYLGYSPGSMPVSEYIASRIFSLPMHPYLTEEEQANVAGAVRSEKQP